jgi:hypothetical protein
MALIVRIDVDRPYGKHPLSRHIISRLSSDFYFPKVPAFGYLSELATVLDLLNQQQQKCYAFFRRCTLPSKAIMTLLDAGGHQLGLHLENSRSYESFAEEKAIIERHTGRKVSAFSKHGSRGSRYGFHHYAPYEAEKYIEWGQRAQMELFLGNLEDPTLPCDQPGEHAGLPIGVLAGARLARYDAVYDRLAHRTGDHKGHRSADSSGEYSGEPKPDRPTGAPFVHA